MASSSSTCPPTRPWKHSVFLSFSGEDVRSNFISHLYKALSNISNDVYIDYRLKPAEEIAPALMKAIEESRIAVIIFSKRYASSAWCLDELEKIIECNKTPGQLDVIPIFYYVDSSHVSDPTIKDGTYAADFARHEKSFNGFEEKLDRIQRLKDALTKKANLIAAIFVKALERHENDFMKKVSQVQRWKDAMIKAANFEGWDSQAKDISSDAILVDKVVKHVLEKLIQISPSNLEGLVGIHSRIEQIKELLSLQSNNVRLLGISGMGGIGKTTLAKALFKQIWFEFDAYCILENIRQESKRPGGLSRLRKELLSRILGREYMMPNIDHTYLLKDILSRKKVLIILDDLISVKQLKTLIGHTSWFGLGSRIIVTSRDTEMVGKKGILGERVHVITPYEVQRLTYSDSFNLFSKHAFEEKHCTDDLWELSNSFVKYARGVPLALEVLGRHLLGRDKEFWENSWSNLEKGPNQDIQSVLKLSYDDLSQDGQKMFLHIACFLNYEDIDVVKQLFNLCDFSVDISYLVEKCLLITSYSDNKVRMHPLLQEMGREIERQKPQRTRLWNHKDICKVFKRKREWESIESLSLDLSKTREVLQLDYDAFARMPNLKFLRFYTTKRVGVFNKDCRVHLPQDLESFPDELLYLYWHGYPLKHLPANFDTTNLVVLKLPHSNVEQLWQGDEDLENLIEVDLRHSHQLMELPSLLRASSLRSAVLRCCTRLHKVPSSIRYVSQLTNLDLNKCRSIRRLPSFVNLKFLEKLNLDGCSSLVEFPEISRSITSLSLNETAIKEVPLSIGDLDNLVELSLHSCPDLRNVPFNILTLKSLERLYLQQLSNLNSFTFSNTMSCLLDDPNGLSSVHVLFLDGTNIESLPDSFKKLSNLEKLSLNSCNNLRSLPELPPTLKSIEANDCRSLETISSIKRLFDSENLDLLASQCFLFTSCPKLDESIWSNLAPDLEIRIQRMAMKAKSYPLVVEPYFRMCYPGSEILEIFACSNEGSSSITIELLPDWNTSIFSGFVLCAVLEPLSNEIHCECHFQNNNGDSNVIMCCSPLPGSTLLLSEHVILWYDYNLNVEIAKRRDWFSKGCINSITFEFFCLKYGFRRDGVKKCGILPLYALDEVSNGVATPTPQPMSMSPMKEEGCEESKYQRDNYDYCYHMGDTISRDYNEEEESDSCESYCSSQEEEDVSSN